MTHSTSSHSMVDHEMISTFQDKLKIKSIVDVATEDSGDIESRLITIQSANNPLLEAAKPLLLTLAQMPQDLRGHVAIESFRQLVEQEIATFQKISQKAGIKREHIITASYCLCTALDEAANSTHWGGSHHVNEIGIWASKLLASTIHSDIDGGSKFFLLISQLIKQPQEHLHLLETLYHILCLGFEGQYASVPNGHQRLETIRHRVLTVLTAVKDPLPRELSPHWQPVDHIKLSKLGKLPVWITGSVFGFIVFTLFSWYQYQLLASKKQISSHIIAMEERIGEPVTLNTKPQAIAKSVPNTRMSDQLSQTLEKEIRRGMLTLNEQPDAIHITLRADHIFEATTAVLSERVLTPLQKIAHYIQANPGQINIIGHTDNGMPIKQRQPFSLARAESVAYALQTQGVQEADMIVSGAGSQSPLNNNLTPINRAHNRRVDIVIMKGTVTAEDHAASLSEQ